jgi:hypothetical protein
VTLTYYVDANLMHDVVTGRSVTGILLLANKTHIDWYSKKQATVETAIYGSELWQHVFALNKVLIFVTLSAIWEFLFVVGVTCFETTNLWLIVLCKSMQRCINATQCCHFIASIKLLPPV